jgi:hypothetical protein
MGPLAWPADARAALGLLGVGFIGGGGTSSGSSVSVARAARPLQLTVMMALSALAAGQAVRNRCGSAEDVGSDDAIPMAPR